MEKNGKIISILRYFLAQELLRNPEGFKKLDEKLKQARTLNKTNKKSE